MSTMQDVKDAKARYDNHCERHRCRIGKCDQRRWLWLAYQQTGENWGR